MQKCTTKYKLSEGKNVYLKLVQRFSRERVTNGLLLNLLFYYGLEFKLVYSITL